MARESIRFPHLLLPALLAMVLSTASRSPLEAEEPAAPRDYSAQIIETYERGQALYEEDDYEGALAEFGKNLALEGEVRRMIEDDSLGRGFVESDAYYAFYNTVFRAGSCHVLREEYPAAIELFQKVREEFRH